MMQPLCVTLPLRTAVELKDPWSPSLDGILGYWWAWEQFGDDMAALSPWREKVPVDLSNVLAAEDWEDGLPWWQCSSPIVPVVQRFTSHSHRRFDEAQAYDALPATVKRVLTAGGPYKDMRHTHTMTLAPYIQWHCIGDPVEIRRLMRNVSFVAAGHTRGRGETLPDQLTITDGDAHLARFHRPLPVAFAEAHGIEGSVQLWDPRPTGWPRARERCVMPARMEVQHGGSGCSPAAVGGGRLERTGAVEGREVAAS